MSTQTNRAIENLGRTPHPRIMVSNSFSDVRVSDLDMTEEQLRVARTHEREQARTLGFDAPNTRFAHGYLEDPAGAGIEDASVGVVISNRVINLSPDKPRVFEEIRRVFWFRTCSFDDRSYAVHCQSGSTLLYT